MSPTENQTGIKLSIIIVSWKVRQLVLDCLESVYRHTRLPRDCYEIFLVDNDSGDGTVEAVRERFSDVHVIGNTDNVGYGAANDQAYERSSAPYALLLNPDSVLLDDAIGKMLDYMEAHGDVAILGSRLLNADHSLQRWTAGAFPCLANAAAHYLFLNRVLPGFMKIDPLYLERDIDTVKEVDWVSGAVMLLRRDHVGGPIFNPRFFMYGEDVEVCHRMKEAGWRVVYFPGASVVHFQGKSMEQQEGDILLHALKGPRNFYTSVHGTTFTALFDFFAVSGFFLRWVIYTVGSTLGGNGHLKEKGKTAKRHLGMAVKVFFRK